MEIAVHGNKKKFQLLQMKLELLLNQIKNENSRYDMKLLNQNEKDNEEDNKSYYYKNFFKTPLTVNNCVESLNGP